MIKYTFFQKNPASHYVYIDMLIDCITSKSISLQLPAWRPGRYELGNFAKNIKKVNVFDETGNELSYKKTNKDCWEVSCANAKSLKVTYSYYAAELNAGACFANDTQIYMNPIHCCFYVLGRENEQHKVELEIPKNYAIACSLEKDGNCLIASNYDELVESPFIASSQLKTEVYQVKGNNFYLHFNGECHPNFEKIKTDFIKFTNYQFEFWGEFPFNEYHFLFQITPFKFYHGVEHFKNTVIALGPGYDLHSEKVYEDLLGVSCHELFHAWNIKVIRPKEMLPYDYTKENYAQTGFVYEGFTTYYGDKNLLSAEVFSTNQYFQTLEERLDKHFHNFGRYNLSVAQSSWDNWLDGYVPGAPYRKTNIYDEGNLIALMLDVMIMQATDNKKSLKDICRILYTDYGKKGKGYSMEDIMGLVTTISGKDLKPFFDAYVLNANDFEEPMTPCLNYLGIELQKTPSQLFSESDFGFKTMDNGNFAKVSLVAPYSPAWKAGLFNNDEIIAVNNVVVRNNLNSLLSYFSNENTIELMAISNELVKTFKVSKDDKGRTWFFKSKLAFMKGQNERQKVSFEVWKAN